MGSRQKLFVCLLGAAWSVGLAVWLYRELATSPRLEWVKGQRFCRAGIMEWEIVDRLDRRGIQYERITDPGGRTTLVFPLDGSLRGKRLVIRFRPDHLPRQLVVVDASGRETGDYTCELNRD